VLDYPKAGAASQAIQTVLQNKTVAATDPTKTLLRIPRLQPGLQTVPCTRTSAISLCKGLQNSLGKITSSYSP